MSQYGAQGFATRGRSYTEILAHYYRGTYLATIPAAARVRVLVADRASVSVAAARPITVTDRRGRSFRFQAPRLRFNRSLSFSTTRGVVRLRPPVWFETPGVLTIDSTPYRGRLVLRPSGSGVSVVNHVDVEHYLRGVVPREMQSSWHPEALKAQAVSARSYAVAAVRPDRLFDLYADTRSQVYGGRSAESRSTDAAIAATAGQVLGWQGRPATTFYHSSSGGHTLSVADGMPGARVVPYLRGVPDPFDRAVPRHRPTRRVTTTRLVARASRTDARTVRTLAGVERERRPAPAPLPGSAPGERERHPPVALLLLLPLLLGLALVFGPGVPALRVAAFGVAPLVAVLVAGAAPAPDPRVAGPSDRLARSDAAMQPRAPQAAATVPGRAPVQPIEARRPQRRSLDVAFPPRPPIWTAPALDWTEATVWVSSVPAPARGTQVTVTRSPARRSNPGPDEPKVDRPAPPKPTEPKPDAEARLQPPVEPLQISDVRLVSVLPASISVAWRTSLPAATNVARSVAVEPTVWSETSIGREHQVELEGLEPETSYRLTLAARDAWGRTTAKEGQATTPPRTGASTTTVQGGAILVDGQPFFPRLVSTPCGDAAQSANAQGVNVFMGPRCNETDAPSAIPGIDVFEISPMGAPAPAGSRSLGSHYIDEWDSQLPSTITREELAASHDEQATSFLTLTSSFYSAAEPLPQGRGMYSALMVLADVLGFGLYPLQAWCRDDAFAHVYDAHRELDAFTGGKPTYQWIETRQMEQCPTNARLVPTPATVRAETWLAVAGGADAVGYTPNTWPDDVGAEITKLNAELGALAPALLADEGVATSRDDRVKVGARILNGALYIVAVNTAATPTDTTIEAPDLAGRSVSVFGENRRLASERGGIVDSFGPLGVHIYIAPPQLTDVAVPLRPLSRE
jgi:stage II sporulation protein D